MHNIHRVIHRKQVFFIKKEWKIHDYLIVFLIFHYFIHSLWITLVDNQVFIHTTTYSKYQQKQTEDMLKRCFVLFCQGLFL